MKKCLLLGVNGQDGSYAAEAFLARGFEVFGIGRQDQSRWLQPQPRFQYIKADLLKVDVFQNILSEVSPDILCLFAALHGSSGFSYEAHWQSNLTVNGLITQASLEFLRTKKTKSSLYYLSSSKVFAPDLVGFLSETSPRTPNCLYSIAKNLSTNLIHYYREKYGVSASVIWTFNHESPRRGSDYFIPNVVGALAQALQGIESSVTLESLDFWCDWGSAREFMGLIVDLAECDISDDFILATGRPVWARDLVETLFSKFNLNYKDHITVRIQERLREGPDQRADLTKLLACLGRSPVEKIEDVCFDILKINYTNLESKLNI
jgi:GDPmannose 4,6-dehydratase